ncbi:MAG: DUF3455 domain-containing protein [Betaproteobacteria bacterium]|nr:DUF3455 domain-containing protein [Betaproteobacteria bacterium]
MPGKPAFIAPEAELLDAGGRSVGRHGAGPYCQASDGSKVVGKLKARVDAPSASAIPWLLLEVTTAGPEGAFSKVTSIQQVNTAGGGPGGGLHAGHGGCLARIPYGGLSAVRAAVARHVASHQRVARTTMNHEEVGVGFSCRP